MAPWKEHLPQLVQSPLIWEWSTKAAGHKYIRKYRGPSGKWVYVYPKKSGGRQKGSREDDMKPSSGKAPESKPASAKSAQVSDGHEKRKAAVETAKKVGSEEHIQRAEAEARRWEDAHKEKPKKPKKETLTYNQENPQAFIDHLSSASDKDFKAISKRKWKGDAAEIVGAERSIRSQIADVDHPQVGANAVANAALMWPTEGNIRLAHGELAKWQAVASQQGRSAQDRAAAKKYADAYSKALERSKPTSPTSPKRGADSAPKTTTPQPKGAEQSKPRKADTPEDIRDINYERFGMGDPHMARIDAEIEAIEGRRRRGEISGWAAFDRTKSLERMRDVLNERSVKERLAASDEYAAALKNGTLNEHLDKHSWDLINKAKSKAEEERAKNSGPIISMNSGDSDVNPAAISVFGLAGLLDPFNKL